MGNPLLDVQKYGQSLWLDHLRRGLITSGELMALVERDGLCGVACDPALFALTLAGSADYDQPLRAAGERDLDTPQEIYEQLVLEDVRPAADGLYPVYLRTGARDGYISLGISPSLAHDTRETIEEARRLHTAVQRENVLLEVPATPAGIPAIRQLISEGINVHATLLFSSDVYEQVADAYMAGLEQYSAKGGDVGQVVSVASFGVSRLDTFVDARLERLLDSPASRQGPPETRRKLKGLIGKAALANARLAYARFRDLYATDRWHSLASRGAHPQRLLWAGTSTRDPRHPRTLYVDELIGPDTINMLSAETISAFREGGKVRPSLTENWAESVEAARETAHALAEVGIPLEEAARTLLEEGLQKLTATFDGLFAAIEKKRTGQVAKAVDSQTFSLGEHASAVQETLDEWRVQGRVRQVWAGDSTLWTGHDENQLLGWLHLAAAPADRAARLGVLAQEARAGNFDKVVLLGMGGSSLAPEVLAHTFGHAPGFPELIVLDSTVPAQIKGVEAQIDLARTLFIVSSKSGGTIETTSLEQYFLARVREKVGPEQAASRFLAITDPRTKLHTRAKAQRFRAIAFGSPGVGGRFSALSNFGLVPAALMGLDVERLLERAAVMATACASCVPPELNPGVALGAVLGALGDAGRDKVTLVLSPGIAALGPWLEQLLAESLGKDGKGLIPVEGERLGAPEVYDDDRLFVHIKLSADEGQEQKLGALERAGHPVVRITLADTLDVGQEFFRWELATACAGSILGVNPFNQPDVEAAKVAAQQRVRPGEEALAAETPLAEEEGIALFADPRNADALLTGSGGSRSVLSLLKAHFRRLRQHDYFALNAFVARNAASDRPLQEVRHAVRDARKVATMLGYGPRLLHSTGQLHKGGPHTGLFLQVTMPNPEDLPIPGQRYTFGALELAQALGDFDVLSRRGARAVRVHVPPDGLPTLARLVRAALG